MIWKVPKLWEDGECWIIGGGPSIWNEFNVPKEIIKNVVTGAFQYSILSPYVSKLHDKHVIGVNNAYLLGSWVDFVFFGDCAYYLAHKTRLDAFPGIKVTCCSRFANRSKCAEEGLKYLAKDRDHTKGISSHPAKVSWNSNSGAAAINLAAHLGVKKIFLLGFDMNLSKDNYSHWHGQHGLPGQKKRPPPFKRHLMGFPVIADDAKKLGIEILNVNLSSTIDDFLKVSLKDVL